MTCDEMTPDRLAEIEARTDAAEPGPWKTYVEEVHSVDLKTYRHIATCNARYPDEARADARFIAAARTDVPALVAAVRERDAEISSLRERLKNAEQCASECMSVLHANGLVEMHDLSCGAVAQPERACDCSGPAKMYAGKL